VIPKRTRRTGLARAILFVGLALAVGLSSTFTVAQTRTAGGKTARPAVKKPKVAEAGPAADPDVDAASTPMATKAESAARHGSGDEAGAGSQGTVIEQKTLDGGAKVFRFGEIEIEGRLKSPQLVYFLRRVRAEFAAGDLGHRTFMRELSDTRTEPAF
jgi:hypothetical protein